jgi:hypothetical protein
MIGVSQAPASLPWPPVSLEDLRSITAREHAAARAILARVQALIAWRDGPQARLDPSTDLPAGDWRPGNETNDYLDAVRHIAAADYDTINHLRWYTNTLVGMKLIHFCPNPGMRSVMPLPKNVREAVTGNLHRLQELLDLYLRMKSNLPPRLLIDPPCMLGEVGAAVDGVIVNQDTVRQQATVATLWRRGVLHYLRRRAAEKGTAHVVEIGAGHGSLCYHLKRLVPQITYTIIDLPEVLVFSSVYLMLTAPEWEPTVAEPRSGPTIRPFGICLVPNYQLGQALSSLPGIDLAVNISSFGEMTPEQVRCYAAGLSEAMGEAGVVFESNEEGQPEIHSSTAGIFADHFAFNAPASAPGIPPFEGTARFHSNQPLESMLVPVEHSL